VDREKRKGDIPIPENLKEMLNEAQRRELPGIKCLGREPWLFRKSLFKDPVLVLRDSNDGRTGIMDEDGRLITQDNIKVREQEGQTQTPPKRNLYYY